MTFQSKDMCGFRELETSEIEAVSGGTDAVEDRFNYILVDGGGSIYDDGFVDTTGDGVADTIVVSAPVGGESIAQLEAMANTITNFLALFGATGLAALTDKGVISGTTATAIGGTAGVAEVETSAIKNAIFDGLLQNLFDNPDLGAYHPSADNPSGAQQ